MEVFGPIAAFGLPLAAAAIVFAALVDRILRVGEKNGWLVYPRRFAAAGIGYALLELHVVTSADAPRTEFALTRLAELDEVGDARDDAHAANVIAIDFARRRRL